MTHDYHSDILRVLYYIDVMLVIWLHMKWIAFVNNKRPFVNKKRAMIFPIDITLRPSKHNEEML